MQHRQKVTGLARGSCTEQTPPRSIYAVVCYWNVIPVGPCQSWSQIYPQKHPSPCMCSVPTCNGISCSSPLDTSCLLSLSREHRTNYKLAGGVCVWLRVSTWKLFLTITFPLKSNLGSRRGAQQQRPSCTPVLLCSVTAFQTPALATMASICTGHSRHQWLRHNI